MSSFNTFQVIIIKSHLVNNDAAALTLASFKRSHLVGFGDLYSDKTDHGQNGPDKTDHVSRQNGPRVRTKRTTFQDKTAQASGFGRPKTS